jgi:hypothetical protein
MDGWMDGWMVECAHGWLGTCHIGKRAEVLHAPSTRGFTHEKDMLYLAVPLVDTLDAAIHVASVCVRLYVCALDLV